MEILYQKVPRESKIDTFKISLFLVPIIFYLLMFTPENKRIIKMIVGKILKTRSKNLFGTTYGYVDRALNSLCDRDFG